MEFTKIMATFSTHAKIFYSAKIIGQLPFLVFFPSQNRSVHFEFFPPQDSVFEKPIKRRIDFRYSYLFLTYAAWFTPCSFFIYFSYRLKMNSTQLFAITVLVLALTVRYQWCITLLAWKELDYGRCTDLLISERLCPSVRPKDSELKFFFQHYCPF